ncbi:MAG: DUF4446 family protein [Negativicutes bacterium]|nr:DUF4446 family protein [Negativicutes bacterium]
MDLLTQANAIIMGNLQYILLAMTAMILLALIVFININLKLNRLNKRYRTMMQGMDGRNLEDLLLTHIEDVRHALKKVDALAKEQQRLAAISATCIQRVGIVRFNAFDDTGSDLSFAVAMLDAQNNGVVVSSIFGRSESRTYAKPIVAGQSAYFLTEEERQALSKAQEKCSKP